MPIRNQSKKVTKSGVGSSFNISSRSVNSNDTFAPNGFSSGCNEFYARTAKDAVRQGREVAHNARLEAAGLKQPETDNVAKLKKAK